MRISFDLDDTLICHGPNIPLEPSPPWYRRLGTSGEPLRLGTCDLFRELERRGCEIFIYTTSYRTPAATRRWLRAYGLRVSRIINQAVHERHFRGESRPPSKNPAAFGIDLHVDDSDGVREEGRRYGFRVLVIAAADTDWPQKVLSAVEQRMQR